eukprot:12936384-Prorocentrum_lima.AAC.1
MLASKASASAAEQSRTKQEEAAEQFQTKQEEGFRARTMGRGAPAAAQTHAFVPWWKKKNMLNATTRLNL